MIYFDNNATTPLADEVLEAMLPYLKEQFYNPSANYRPALKVRKAIELAREQVAALIGAYAHEIVFCSGGTEASNSALAQCERWLIAATDHPASLQGIERSFPAGSLAPVLSNGSLDLALWKELLPAYQGASFAWANHETGVIQPVKSLCQAADDAGVLVHVDMVQAAGKVPIAMRDYPISYASLSAHKFHGPKGIGALFIREAAPWNTRQRGGHQESARRAGTENVAGIIGFGRACELAMQAQHEYRCVEILRNDFERALRDAGLPLHVHGEGALRLPHVSNCRFEGISAQSLTMLMEPAGLICAAGAACSSHEPKPSQVLLAMGLSDVEARAALRFSMSRMTTQQEMQEALKIVLDVYRRLKEAQSAFTGPVMVYKP